MLSKLIETKEQELNKLGKKQKELKAQINELTSYLSAKKKVCSDFEDWGEKFDLQDMATKKSMFINVVDRITVYDDMVTVQYKFKCDYLKGGSKYNNENKKAVNDISLIEFLPPKFVLGTKQSNPAKFCS